MSFVSKFFNSLNTIPQEGALNKFLNHNNAPVNQYCSLIPIVQPSLISTSFGQSLITLTILLIYFSLYISSDKRTGVESRILTSLLIGNLIFTILSFNDWFNLKYEVIFCNDYKNGVSNLYQVSELIETYKLTNLLVVHFNYITLYVKLVYKQFFHIIGNSYSNFITFINESFKEAKDIIQEFKSKKN